MISTGETVICLDIAKFVVINKNIAEYHDQSKAKGEKYACAKK
jgi:hypothetical protein